MIDETTQGLHVIATGTQGVRTCTARRRSASPGHQGPEGPRAGDRDRGHHVPGLWRPDRAHAVRQRLHLAADRRGGRRRERVNVYLVNKHYEVAPVLSMTEHEANNALVWISDKLWQSLNAEQKKWVQAAARDEISKKEPAKAFELEKDRGGQAEIDRASRSSPTSTRRASQKIADPYLDKLAKELGPHAEKIKNLIRAIN
jgi:hypothetical protein